jgi:hypothetical protein
MLKLRKRILYGEKEKKEKSIIWSCSKTKTLVEAVTRFCGWDPMREWTD